MAFIPPALPAAAVALSALAIVSIVALRGWRDWIQLKREELAAGHAPMAQDAHVPNAGSRIEIADNELVAISESEENLHPTTPVEVRP